MCSQKEKKICIKKIEDKIKADLTDNCNEEMKIKNEDKMSKKDFYVMFETKSN